MRDKSIQWCSAGYKQVHRVYPLIFQSVLSIPTSNPICGKSAVLRLFTKDTSGPWTTCKVFSCVDALRSKEYFTQNV